MDDHLKRKIARNEYILGHYERTLRQIAANVQLELDAVKRAREEKLGFDVRHVFLDAAPLSRNFHLQALAWVEKELIPEPSDRRLTWSQSRTAAGLHDKS